MEVIKFNEDNLDYFNSLFNKVEDLETILESLPVADRYIKNNGSEIANTTKSKVNSILQSKKWFIPDSLKAKTPSLNGSL